MNIQTRYGQSPLMCKERTHIHMHKNIIHLANCIKGKIISKTFTLMRLNYKGSQMGIANM